MITEQLKTATLQAHQQLEKLLVQQIKSVNSVSTYLNLLKLFYGFCHPLETMMMPMLSSNVIPDLATRRKSDALLNDMKSLGAADAVLPESDLLPLLSNTGEALGALYVMEGSTLGGAVIANMIKARISELPDEALGFFNGYGAATYQKWWLFKQWVDAYATGEEQGEAVIYGANETFQAFYQWVQTHQTAANA